MIESLVAFTKLAAGLWLATLLLYNGFLSYCTLRQMRDSGRLGEMPKVAQAHCWGSLYFFLSLDVLFNITLGSMVFLESPEMKRLTFTARCKKWMGHPSWRGKIAGWVCKGWLNPGEPGHC